MSSETSSKSSSNTPDTNPIINLKPVKVGTWRNNLKMTLEEEPWNDRTEMYIWGKQKDAIRESKKQKNEGDKNRQMFYIISIPSIVISAVMTFVVAIIDEEENRWVPPFFFMALTILSSITALMNYGEKYGTNYAFSKDYQTIVSMIQLEMTRKASFRRSADLFMNEIRLRMEFLNRESPNIIEKKNSSRFNILKLFDIDVRKQSQSEYNRHKKTDEILGIHMV